MIYYKGIIVDDLYIKSYKQTICIGEDRFTTTARNIAEVKISCEELSAMPNTLNRELKQFILDMIDGKVPKANKNLIKFFGSVFQAFVMEKIEKGVDSIDESTIIIYELVSDKDGNLFGKELYTNELFPIYSSKSQKFNYKIIVEQVKGHSWSKYFLEIYPDIYISSLLKCGQIIIKHRVADKNDVEYYLNMFNQKGLFKKKNIKAKEKFKQRIICLANENVFKEDFSLEKKETKVKPLEKQSIETTLMEDIEYNLVNLKNIDENLYREYRSKYERLLNSFITKESLALLLGEIEFSLIFKKQNVENILEVINNLKREYLDNFLNKSGNKTELDLRKLDKINELFLKIKSKYDYKSQRSVLLNLAFLYFLEVYENKDTIDINDLNNSYFKTHLKSIIMLINLLIEYGIIECSYIINLRDDITSEIVLDVIKSIKFMNIDNEKIKRIGELQWI